MARTAATGGRLTLVATPIGNLGDVTARAVEELRRADAVLAEDTRRTRALLTHLGISGKPVERLDAVMEHKRLAAVLGRLAAGEQVVLVSDAGTPTVSDPGALLVREAARVGHAVSALPGPSAVTAALAASGFPADRFRFFGFLPRKGTPRQKMLAEMAATEETLVLFESPARLSATLTEAAAALGPRDAVIAREISKAHEELVRAPLSALAALQPEHGWRGEITLVIGPMTLAEDARASEAELDARIADLAGEDSRPRDVAKALARETGWDAREIYRRVVALRGAAASDDEEAG